MLPIAPLLCLFAVADINLPNPAKLIRDAIAAEEKQETRKEQFTWREDEIRPGEKTKTFDVIMLEGENYRKLILIDGKPLDAKTAEKVNREMEKTREERKHRKALSFHTTMHTSSLGQLTRLFENKVTGEEVVNGRKAWRMESEPRAGAKTEGKDEEEVLATRRVTWFDEDEGAEVRHVTTYIRAVHQVQPGNRLDAELSKVGDSWLMSEFRFHADLRFLPGVHARGDVTYRYYDYKRFTAESTFVPN